jgi:hypothetical protein
MFLIKIHTHSNTNKKKFTPPAFNIQIDVGDGDHIAFFGGSTNVDVKVGNGAHYTLMYLLVACIL